MHRMVVRAFAVAAQVIDALQGHQRTGHIGDSLENITKRTRADDCVTNDISKTGGLGRGADILDGRGKSLRLLCKASIGQSQYEKHCQTEKSCKAAAL